MYINSLQNLIDILRRKRPPRIYNKSYGFIYLPCYPKYSIQPGSSNLYNEYGEKLEEIFIRDEIWASNPYRKSRYFVFDRYNIGLKTHLYTHRFILETVGKPDRKFACLVESENITPHDYKMFDQYKGLNKDFDLILTHSAQILDKYENARFAPFCASLFGSSVVDKNHYLNKTKDVSILSSWKRYTPLNIFRVELAEKCKREHLADTYGTFDGGRSVNIQTTLKDYRYTISIENAITPYFFTEKIIAPFANQTIPIYLGATEIDKFFNPDGIIKITQKSDIEKVLKQCTKEEYERRLPAILDNYERAKEYYEPWDYVYKNYLKQNK